MSVCFKRFKDFTFAVILILFPVILSGAGKNDTVYVTNSGEKYHRAGCSALSRSRIAVSLIDALNSGYTPCSICLPPLAATEENASPRPGIFRVNVEGLQNTGDASIAQMVKAEVVDHVDGDTIRVRIPNPPGILGVVETIRLLGVDTPETVHPNRPVERFGREASEFTRANLLGKTVYLAFDWDLRDHYGRLLAYVYTGEGRCFNAAIVEAGYAFAYTEYAFQFMEEFRLLERKARSEGAGFWAGSR